MAMNTYCQQSRKTEGLYGGLPTLSITIARLGNIWENSKMPIQLMLMHKHYMNRKKNNMQTCGRK